MLKKLIIGAAFSALIASSAMAQSYQPMLGSGNIIPGPNGGFASVPMTQSGSVVLTPVPTPARPSLAPSPTSRRPCITAIATTQIVSGITTKVGWQEKAPAAVN